MAVLIDTGPLVALVDASDEHHLRVRELLETEPEPLIVPAVVLPEVTYLVGKYAGAAAELGFLSSVISGELPLEWHGMEDLKRAHEILATYNDQRFGYVDAVVMAMGERLGIRRIATLDRRHFSAFRPRHCQRYELI